MEDISIIIPAYNEEQSIRKAIEEIEEVMRSENTGYELIVVDDGSEDKTAEEISQCENVRLIQHSPNKGYGASLKTGIKNAKNNIIVITDADGTYPPNQIPRLLKYIDKFDMVVGARTGENVKIPFFRRPAKFFLTKLSCYLTRTEIPDLNSGLRAFRKDIVNQFLNILPQRFSFTTTITLALLLDNFNVKYIPINYHSRIGKSKIKPIRDTINFFTLVLRIVTYFDPLRVLLPISFFFLTLGAARLLYDVISKVNISDSVILLMSLGIQIGIMGLLADLIVKSSKRWRD